LSVYTSSSSLRNLQVFISVQLPRHLPRIPILEPLQIELYLQRISQTWVYFANFAVYLTSGLNCNHMKHEEYLQKFAGKVTGSEKTRSEKALDLALDIRKFEIELYWKRATYFWAFIATALAGYAVAYKGVELNPNAWLSLLFSSLGLTFSTAWYLVNRGSKFWQNNWERHVDLLEDQVFGPLYKTIAQEVIGTNPLTASAPYSVSKINQMLSVFISSVWLFLFISSLLPLSASLPINWPKVLLVLLTACAIGCLFRWGRSDNNITSTKLILREVTIEP
jgi:hypothetical protein